jgi:hypothetical protein
VVSTINYKPQPSVPHTKRLCSPRAKGSHADIPGWRALVEIATQNEGDAQRDGNRGQEQVSHVHRRLQQNTSAFRNVWCEGHAAA